MEHSAKDKIREGIQEIQNTIQEWQENLRIEELEETLGDKAEKAIGDVITHTPLDTPVLEVRPGQGQVLSGQGEVLSGQGQTVPQMQAPQWYSVPVPEMENLSAIIKDFHATWGGGKIFPPEHEENAAKQIASLPDAVKRDELYRNAMKNSDAQNARVESDRATLDAVLETMGTGIELYRAVHENEAFKSWLLREVFDQTYQARM